MNLQQRDHVELLCPQHHKLLDSYGKLIEHQRYCKVKPVLRLITSDRCFIR